MFAFDNVSPQACRLGDADSALRRLGRLRDAEAPSIRAVLVLSDADLEALKQRALSAPARDTWARTDWAVSGLDGALWQQQAAARNAACCSWLLHRVRFVKAGPVLIRVSLDAANTGIAGFITHIIARSIIMRGKLCTRAGSLQADRLRLL